MQLNLRVLSLITGLLVGIIVVAALIFHSLTVPKRTLTVSGPLGANVQYPYLVSPRQFLYFNTSTFVSFDIASQTSKALTPVYLLPNVLDVRWTSQGALFKASDYSADDQLYAILNVANIPTDESYWWHVNFATGQIRLAGHLDYNHHVIDAIWQPTADSYISLENTVGSEGLDTGTILSRLTVDGVITEIMPLNDAHQLVSTDGNNVYYRDKSNKLKRANLAAKSTNIILEHGSSTTSISRNSQTIMYIDFPSIKQEGSYHDSGNLTQYDSQKNTPTILAEDFSGSLTYDNTGQEWAAWGTVGKAGTPTGFFSHSGKTEQLILNPNDKQKKLPEFFTLAGRSENTLLFTDEQNQAYIASTEALAVKIPPDQKPLQQALYQETYYMIYDDQKRQYTIYILKSPFRQNVEAVLTNIRSQGFDPYQLNIKWYAYDGVDPRS